MKKIIFLIVCVLIAWQAKSQSLKAEDFRFDNKGRPDIDRIFKTADGTLSMIYYMDATVSFYNNEKYTKAFVVHNIAEPLSMMIERGEGEKNDMLYYSFEKSSYTDRISGKEYILDKSSVKQMEASR